MGNVFVFCWEIPLMEAFRSVSGSILTAVATFVIIGLYPHLFKKLKI